MKSKINDSEKLFWFFILAFLRGSKSFQSLLFWTILLNQFDISNSKYKEIYVKVTEMPKENKKNFLKYTPIVISSFSLFVSIVSTIFAIETQLLSRQGAFLPAISIYYSWEIIKNNETKEQDNILRWKIENNGMGPAIVKDSKLKVSVNKKEKSIGRNDEEDILDTLINIINEHFELTKDEPINYSEDNIETGYSIKPSAQWNLFELKFTKVVTEEQLREVRKKINIGICSCSLDLRCWYSDTYSFPSESPKSPIVPCDGEINQDDMNKLLGKPLKKSPEGLSN